MLHINRNYIKILFVVLTISVVHSSNIYIKQNSSPAAYSNFVNMMAGKPTKLSKFKEIAQELQQYKKNIQEKINETFSRIYTGKFSTLNGQLIQQFGECIYKLNNYEKEIAKSKELLHNNKENKIKANIMKELLKLNNYMEEYIKLCNKYLSSSNWYTNAKNMAFHSSKNLSALRKAVSECQEYFSDEIRNTFFKGFGATTM